MNSLKYFLLFLTRALREEREKESCTWLNLLTCLNPHSPTSSACSPAYPPSFSSSERVLCSGHSACVVLQSKSVISLSPPLFLVWSRPTDSGVSYGQLSCGRNRQPLCCWQWYMRWGICSSIRTNNSYAVTCQMQLHNKFRKGLKLYVAANVFLRMWVMINIHVGNHVYLIGFCWIVPLWRLFVHSTVIVLGFFLLSIVQFSIDPFTRGTFA